MDARLQRRVQRYGWDKASGWYEQYWREQLRPAQERALAMADLQPGARVIDTACGTGLITFEAARLVGSGGRVVGTDLSQDMIDRASDQARARGVSNVEFERMDAEDLKVPAESFDVWMCGLGLMYVPDPSRALAEAYRVIRPGDLLRHTFEAAAFTDVRVDRIASVLRYESAEEACGAAFVGGPVALAYSRFDDQVREAAHAEYLASIEPYRRSGGNGYDVPGEFVVAWGHR